MEVTTLAKILCASGFFLEVMIFGRVVSSLDCFQDKRILSIAMSFAGGLFLSISILHILPQATHSLDQYLSEAYPKEAYSSSTLREQWFPPFCFMIAALSYLIIMYIDKVLIGGHDHEYELSFVREPRRSQEPIEIDMPLDSPHMVEEPQRKSAHDNNQHHHTPTNSENKNTQNDQQQIEKIQSEVFRSPNSEDGHNDNWKPIILQVGVSIHAFFQCLAVGIQSTTVGVLSLAIAIFVHKWAEGLTLGLMYEKNGYSKTVVTIAIFFQALINVVGLTVGAILSNSGPLTSSIFMSISAGTFLYISTVEVLPEQLEQPNKKKWAAILLANLFITGVFFVEKATQSN